MDGESTREEQSINEEEPTLDANRTLEDENLVDGNELLDKENVSTPAQTHSSPVEDQHTVDISSPPTHQRKVLHIVLYAVFLLIGIVLGVVGIATISTIHWWHQTPCSGYFNTCCVWKCHCAC